MARNEAVVDRVVVGAHYGLRDWLAQRVTAAIMAVYTVIVLVVLVGAAPLSYAVWSDLFTQGWMRVATLLFAASLAWHAWVGMRDILMDYVSPTGTRLALEVLVVLMLAGYLGWAVQILWR
ncbi:MAG: succinate dehydrogenase, hydrophobic membrane anchor protein [Burkholderiales bacterium]